jgi:CspA family cold shock protein
MAQGTTGRQGAGSGVPLRRRTIDGAWRPEGRSRHGQRPSGTVKWSTAIGATASSRPEQGEEVFVHLSAVQGSGPQTLQEGQAVEFDFQQGRKGSQAANVRRRQARASG